MDRRQKAYEEEGGTGAEKRTDLVGEDGYHGGYRRLGACAEEPTRRRHFRRGLRPASNPPAWV